MHIHMYTHNANCLSIPFYLSVCVCVYLRMYVSKIGRAKAEGTHIPLWLLARAIGGLPPILYDIIINSELTNKIQPLQ
jgi:hypothetical protein